MHQPDSSAIPEHLLLVRAIRHAVVVGFLRADKAMLLIRTSRLPENWHPIGGGVDPDDVSLVAALQREIREEMEIDFPAEGFTYHITQPLDFGEGELHFYTASLSEDIAIQFDPKEIIEWRWFAPHEVADLNLLPAMRAFIEHIYSPTKQSNG